jgi:copper chaperone CopZ
MQCEHCPVFIRRSLAKVPGVADVGAYRAMHLTSVLYDPECVHPEALAKCLRKAGFSARVITGPLSSP